MKVFLGADHAGFKLKELLKQRLEKKYSVKDLSPTLIEGDDYPDVATMLAHKVVAKKTLGILICGTGIGVSIAANKIKGIRAGHVTSELDAQLAKQHNNCNIITFSKSTDIVKAERMVNVWLNAKFLNGRHARRIRKISALE